MLSPSPLLYPDQLIKNGGGFEVVVWQGGGGKNRMKVKPH